MSRWLSAALATVLLLSGCATIPNSGDVNEGNGEVKPAEPLFPIVEGPQAGAEPASIVQGFMRASAGGVASDFSIAREYLTDSAAASWNPYARTVVFDSGYLVPETGDDGREVTYDIPVAGVVDAHGRLEEAHDNSRIPLQFTLVEVEPSVWRISSLEDGIVIAEATFNQQFRQTSLAFVAKDLSTVVPDVRFFPRNTWATRATQELVLGPSAWLADSVLTGFPSGVEVDGESVLVEDGQALVSLTQAAPWDAELRAMADAQLRATLTAIPDVRDVKLTINNLPVGGSQGFILERAAAPTGNAATVVDGRLGIWDGMDFFVTAPELGRIDVPVSGLAVSNDLAVMALLLNSQNLYLSQVLSGGPNSLVKYVEGAEVDDVVWETGEPALTGQSLLAPAVDRYGWVWTAESQSSGALTAINGNDPTQVLSIETPWLEGRTLKALAVSRDAARIVLLSTEGGQQSLDIIGISREASGQPVSLSEPHDLGSNLPSSTDVVWLDDVKLAVLSNSSADSTSIVSLVTVDGWSTRVEGSSGATSISARNGDRSMVLVNGENQLVVRRGSTWTLAATKVADLAFAG